MGDPVIVAYGRSAVGKAGKGALRHTRPDDLAAQVICGVLRRVPNLDPASIDDVIVGNAFPEAEQGFNLARISAQLAGLPQRVPGQTVNRFCASGLQSIAAAVGAISAGYADVVLAGGVESMSLVPMAGNVLLPNPQLMDSLPGAYATMGVTAENVARTYGVSRAEQDEFALRSHHRAEAAQRSGRFNGQIIPVEARSTVVGEDGQRTQGTVTFSVDEGVRPGLTGAALERLRPVFSVDGSVTAGNSSQMSDAAAFALVMSEERARAAGLVPLARVIGFAVVGVAPELMGIGPIEAIPVALARAGVDKSELDLIELNEAFASQAIHCIRQLELDPDRVNVNGGAIAMGHPLGCTGALLTGKLLEELDLRQARFGMVSMCIGGGMGAAAVIERFPTNQER